VKEHLLVVEDDMDLLSTMCTVLRCCGYEVDGARRLDEASEWLERRSVDVILLDLLLGGGRCDEFLEELARRDAAPATILCSATPRLAKEVAERFAISYVSKPFEMERLLDAIADAHAQHRRPSLVAA
jgi:DNA-binding NtrC family response regulator